MKKAIIIYTKRLLFVNGIYTWIVNFCKLLGDEYNILVLSKQFSVQVRSELNKYANTEMYVPSKIYSADTVIYNFDFGDVPTNIKANHNYTILHCDYSKVTSKVDINPETKYIAVSKQAADGFTEKYNLPCDNIESVIPEQEPKKILRLISCTRMLPHKGADRIYELAKQFDRNNIKYLWINFSDKDQMANELIKKYHNPNVIQMPAISNSDLINYIADSDYLVQLSDHEGYCFSVHESLKVQTPVIVTDIPVFNDLVIDGVNGYKVPLDMNNIDVIKIANKIPRDFNAYKQDIEGIRNKWGELLC